MLNWVVTAKIGSAPKGWNGRQEESEEEGARNNHWRGGILVSRGENGADSRRAASGGRDGIQTQQGFSTGWAEKCFFWQGWGWWGEFVWQRGVGVSFEKQSEGSQEQALRRAEEAEIADLDETPGQDVLEKAVNEVFGGEGAELDLAGIGRAVAKGDLVIFELDQTAVADCDAEDVGSQVLEGSVAVADRFTVDDPIMLPDGGWDIVGKFRSLESMKEFSPEDPGEGFDWEKKVMVGREPGAVIGGQSTGRDEIVNVRMVG